MRILAIADAVSPFIYSENFPSNLPPFDIIISAGDMPGYVLEYIATKTGERPIYVLGNHLNGYVQSEDKGYGSYGAPLELPGGCDNAHGRVISYKGMLIAGFEGCGRYKEGAHQYSAWQYRMMLYKMAPHLMANRLRYGRAVDILLTHAAPQGPHEGSDFPHRGIGAFNTFHTRWKPKIHIHGHVHLNGANAPREYVTEEGVRVINAFEFALIDL